MADRYKVITTKSPAALTRDVNEAIESGYMVVGPASALLIPDGNIEYMQTVCKFVVFDESGLPIGGR